MRRAIPLVLILLAACGGKERTAAAPAEEVKTAAAPAEAPGGPAEVDWIDPEPAGAQARAEQAVGAEWNRNKSTLLTMRITTLVDRTSGIEGFASALAARNVSVDERLARLGAKVTDQQIVITLPGSVLFDFDKADIRADAERTLAEVVEVIGAYAGRPVRIEGHTDSMASDSYNQALSERRAKSVASWLAGRGVPAARLSTAGLGETRPVGDNATAAGRQRNRRVEIVIGKVSS